MKQSNRLNILLLYKWQYTAQVKYALLFCSLLLNTLLLSAQTDTTAADSLQEDLFLDISNAHVEYFKGEASDHFMAVDTSIDRFQKFNPARNQVVDYAYLGNLGAPYYPRFFEFDRYLGFDYGRHERDLYLTDINELNYYRTTIPYTDLSYVIGSNSEQYFRVLHTRNVGPDFNFSVSLDKIASTGFYQHSLNNYVNVSATAWYKTKRNRYAVYFGGVHSENTNEENGGINNDTLFDLPNPDLAVPFRSYAFTEWKNWQGQVMQQFNFYKQQTISSGDSATTTFSVPLFSVKHTFGAHDYDYLLEDLYDSLFYSFLYEETDTLRDISDVDGYYNKLAVVSTPLKYFSPDSSITRHFNWELYALQQYHEVSDQSDEYIFRNFIAGVSATLNNLADSAIHIHADAAYDLIAGTYEGNASAWLTGFNIEPRIGVSVGKYEPTQLQDHYYGFRFRWENEFEPVSYLKFFLDLHVPVIKADLIASFSTFTNYTFSGFTPEQIDGALDVQQVLLRKNFVLGDFHLNNTVGYQVVSSHLNLPEFITAISWYYQANLFHSALFTQIGFDAWYTSVYVPHTYNFITGQFDERIYSTTDPFNPEPVVDIFANFDIRTFRFFVKMDNITQGLFSKGYYESPNYPMQPRGIKFGVNWMLFY